MLAKAIQRRLYGLRLSDEEAEAVEHRVWQALNTCLLVGGNIAVIRPEGGGNSRMTVLELGELVRQMREGHDNT